MKEKPRRDVLLIATLDTKEEVVEYLRNRLLEKGKTVLLLDCSMAVGRSRLEPEITREEIAQWGGAAFSAVATSDQFEGGRVMMEGIRRVVSALFAERKFRAALGIGGSNGTLMATAGMQELPVGVPKVMISAMACGNVQFGPYVGTKDIIMIPSVADILGINSITKPIFDNAVHALVAMLDRKEEPFPPGQEQIALSMLGQTTPAGMAGRALLEKEGYRVVAFHPNGVGGAAMEEWIARGAFVGVWELTPHEVADELLSRIHSAGPNRMTQAAEMGLPQVVVPGCVDFFYGSPGPPHELASRFRERQTYMINSQIMLVKITAGEAVRVARELANKMNRSRGPVTLVVPRKGISRYDRPQYPFYNPEVDRVLFEEMKKALSSRIRLVELDLHISDPQFGEACASILLEMIKPVDGPLEVYRGKRKRLWKNDLFR